MLTGCMRISKESIFTGLNNFTTFTIADVDFDEYFGFTDQEVRDLLTYYECTDKYESIKEWYDGYRFGNVDVYLSLIHILEKSPAVHMRFIAAFVRYCPLQDRKVKQKAG